MATSAAESDANNSVVQSRFNNNSSLSSPWAHVVRGESEAVLAEKVGVSDSDSFAVKASSSASSSSSSSSPDNSLVEAQGFDGSDNSKSNVPQTKKHAWNKPSNGAVEAGHVMDAFSWPALSESAKASPKSSSDSLKALSDGSTSVAQGSVNVSSPQKQASGNNGNPNLSQNNVVPTRQKSMKRVGGGGGGPPNGAFAHPNQPSPPPPPPPPGSELPQNTSGKQSPVIPPEPSLGSPHHHKNKNWEQRGGQSHGGNDHPQQQHHQRNSSRRGGGGTHSRGDGSYHNNHGRRDHDRANYDWNSNRSFNGRDAYMQQQRVNQRNFIRPQPPTPAPSFIGPPPVRPFAASVMIPGSPLYFFPAPPPDSMRGVPYVHAAPFMIVPPAEPQLRSMITNQIDYYFSSENLCKDVFLRTQMDEQGWVPLSVVANFNRVKKLTSNIQLILECVRNSTVVEMQGDKLRKRNDWMNWPPLSPLSPGVSSHEMLANRFQTIGLEDGKTNTADRSTTGAHVEASASGSVTVELDSQLQASNGEGHGKLR
ncbi:hypothetical protein Syun_005464 [Stephania yunnanensis]|uniref:HTH La-type RNA-binding domain-containing protein n=1 Tax=Stephania yunnanensis TaxID=152371 RepID=A0AAP0L4R8_9MAGN